MGGKAWQRRRFEEEVSCPVSGSKQHSDFLWNSAETTFTEVPIRLLEAYFLTKGALSYVLGSEKHSVTKCRWLAEMSLWTLLLKVLLPLFLCSRMIELYG